MKKTLSIVFTTVTAALTAACFMLLPETVAVQIGSNGQVSNTMSKLPAIIIPAAISVLGIIMMLTEKGKNVQKSILISVAGIAVMIFELIFNL